MDQHKFNELMSMLQAHWASVGKYQDLEAKCQRAILVLAEKDEELSQINHDLANAKAGLTAQMAANEEQHREDLRQLQAQIRQAQKELAQWNAEVTAVEAKLKDKRYEYEALQRGKDALRAELVAAIKAA